MSDTNLLALPYLAASQAQKHVTLNDALTLLDGTIHLSVISRVIATPPATPLDGDRYLIAAGPTGLWVGHAGHIAFRVAGAWRFLVPRTGWRMWVEAEALLVIYNGTVWVSSAVPTVLQNLSLLGVNATADATNKMAVNTAAVLFNNVGAGIQFKINKNAATDTASLLFQSGFSGRAEIGNTGDDDLHFKVSANGSTFNESLIVSSTSGKATFKNTLALDPQAAEPATPTNGQLWYNSTTGKFRGQQNGTSVDIIGAGGGAVTDGTKGDIVVSGGGTVWTVGNTSVSNPKLAQMPAFSMKGNNLGSTGNVTDLSVGQIKLLLALATADISGLGTLATQSGTFSGSHSGASSGTNTGDQNTFLNIAVAGQSTVVADTATDTLTLVAGTNVTITTDAANDTITINAAGGGGGGVSDGDKGDIAVSGLGTVWTIDPATISNTKLATMPALSFKANATTAAAAPQDLTADQTVVALNLHGFVHARHLILA
jgi:Protein of unknown function (DUF2793)